MNEQAILHLPETKFCFATDFDIIVLRLRVAKQDRPDTVQVIYGGKYEFSQNQFRQKMERSYEDSRFAYYTAKIILEDVRFVYVFAIEEGGVLRYFSEDGLTDTYDFTLSYYNSFQVAYINAADVLPSVSWMHTAVFYQIFVDRFCCADKHKDKSYINLAWGDIPDPKSFAGGDLAGITCNLGYLQDLGINALYLTPVFRSVSNHKYDISDYYDVDPQFGTREDLKKLVESAHERGMRVVLDAVFNHCSDRISFFRDVLLKGKNSQYYDWFLIAGDKPTAFPLNYECFGACTYMPKFNTSNPEVQRYLLGVAQYWIREYDIDGWRLDVSDEVSHDFWRKFRSAVKSVKEDCVIIGENWHDANPYLQGDQYDSIMNYAFTKACLDLFAFGTLTAAAFAAKLNELLMRNTDTVNGMMLNLLDTHDTHRFLTRLDGNEERLRCALCVLYFYLGAPCIYYGTENAMLGGYDPDCRRTFDWAKSAQDTKLKRLIRFLAKLRGEGSLAGENIRIYEKDGLLFLERGEDNALRLTVNTTGAPLRIRVQEPLYRQKYEGEQLLPDGFLITR